MVKSEVNKPREEGIERARGRVTDPEPSSKSDERCEMSDVPARNQELGTKDLSGAIRRVLDGDANAYEGIYAVCDRALRAFVSRRYGRLGGDFIDEVAIRTHEYAVSHLNSYDPDKGASFQTWLIWQSRSIAGHVAREWFSRRFVRYNQAAHEAWALTETGPGDVYEEKRLWRVLQEETEALPEDERRTVVVHDIEARSHPEIAKATGLTYEQVRYRRRLVLKSLRRRLMRRGVSPVPVDATPAPIWYGENRTDAEDDFTSSVTAVLPDGPDTLVGAAAKEEDEE